MADNIEDLKKELAATKKALADAKTTGIVSPPVPGTFTVEGETADGKVVKKKYRFKNGRTRTPLPNGQQIPSEMLIKKATGKTIKDDEYINYPWARSVTKEDAQAVLDALVKKAASTIEEA